MNQTHTIDLPPEWASNPWIQECLSRMERFSNDPLKVEEYEEAEKALLTYATHLEWKHREGLEEGLRQGMEKGIEHMVQTLHKNGLDLEAIAQLSDLTLEEVKRLLRKEP